MPAVELMTWVPDQKRWMKWYRGRMYARSPRQLGTEPTKEASRTAANDWWDKKQQQVDESLGAAKKHPSHITKHYQEAIENHRLYAKWLRRYGDTPDAPERAAESEAIIEWLRDAFKSDTPPYPLKPEQHNPVIDLTVLNHHEYVRWRERFSQIRREEKAETAPPPENTIRAHIDDYLAFRRGKVAAGKNTLGTFDTYRGRLIVFRKWVDALASVETLNEALWERFYSYLAQRVAANKMTQSTMVGTMNAAREFIRSRWERRYVELPRNLNSRALAVSPALQDIVLFTNDEIKKLFGKALPNEELYLLLMLNCGMYPVDIAMLKQTEVDWDAGRISRKRSKTRNRSENVPCVDYPLWKRTFDLLKQHRSEHRELVLLNRNGTALWKEVEKDGKIFRISNIKCNFFRIQKKTKIKKSLKLLRKTAASKLEEHEVYGRYAEYFLGEAPSSVASRHYVRPSGEQFDAAIRWLGLQFGIEPVAASTSPAPSPAATATPAPSKVRQARPATATATPAPSTAPPARAKTAAAARQGTD